MTDLWTAIEACDRLNSWLRSPTARGEVHRPQKAVYWLKGHLLNAVTRTGLAQHRLIVVEVKCRSCEGTGKWVSWDTGPTNQRCRKCNAAGKHPLYFIETTMAEHSALRTPHSALQWHTPVPHGAYAQYPFQLKIETLQPAQPVSDWAPLREGKPLELWEVARDLNVVESFIVERPGVQIGDYGPYDHFDYSLYVGEQSRVCFRCQRPEEKHAICCSREAVAWCGWLCAECDKTFDHMMHWSEQEKRYVCPNSAFDACPFPLELIAHPEIQAWQQRQLKGRRENEQ